MSVRSPGSTVQPMTSNGRNKARVDRLWAMQVFSRVIETGSFSRAAASLDLANSTVTACVQNLEDHLGAALIDRNTRFLSLTAAGVRFLADSEQILQAVERAEAGVHEAVGEMRGAIRIEMPIAIGQALICPALNAFAALHPAISVQVTLTNQPRSLIESGSDLAIRMGTVEEADLVARPIYQARYVVCATPQRARGLPDHPARLDRQACLGLLNENRSTQVEWLMSRGGETVTIAPAGRLSFNSSEALIGAALGGAGLVHVLDVFANRHIASRALAEVYTDWTKEPKACYAVTTKARAGSQKIRALVDFLLETLDAQRRPEAWESISVATPKTQRV